MRNTSSRLFGWMGAVLAWSLAASPARAALTLPAVLGDHMVLQRGMPVPIWGLSETGVEIVVTFADQTKTTRSDGAGRWRVKLDPLAASSQPRTLVIRAGPGPGQTREIQDVLVGEVWVGSGQSNMDLPVLYSKQDAALTAAAAQPHARLRLLRSGDRAWTLSVPLSNRNFSGLLFAFGLRLQEELGVPVGLLEGAVGGTPSSFWLSQDAYRAAEPACAASIAAAQKTFDAKRHQQEVDSLTAAWKQAVAKAEKEGTRVPRATPLPLRPGERRGEVGHLFEKHIRPFMPFAMRGVLWDQGENGTGIGGLDQVTMMGALITGWRREWGQGDFPFLYVQKPSGGGCAWDPANPDTRQADALEPLPAKPPANGESRELHIRISRYPHTAMVTSSDLGGGIHPVNKSGYGARAARVAMGLAYGATNEIVGPLYRSHTTQGREMRIRFDHAGQGLVAGPAGTTNLQGFAVAGADRVFHWADAVIEPATKAGQAADTVRIWSDRVAAPAAVRYAWAQQHPWANLFNRDGLPAPAFRTDDW